MSVAVARASPIPSAQGTPAASGAVPEKHGGVPPIPAAQQMSPRGLFSAVRAFSPQAARTHTAGSRKRAPRHPRKAHPGKAVRVDRKSPRRASRGAIRYAPLSLRQLQPRNAPRRAGRTGRAYLQAAASCSPHPLRHPRDDNRLRWSVRNAAWARPLHGDLWSHGQPMRPLGGLQRPHPPRTLCLHRVKGRAMRHPRRMGTRSRDGHGAKPPAPVIPLEHAHAAPKAGIPT